MKTLWTRRTTQLMSAKSQPPVELYLWHWGSLSPCRVAIQLGRFLSHYPPQTLKRSLLSVVQRSAKKHALGCVKLLPALS